jgi:hypothetical protein
MTCEWFLKFFNEFLNFKFTSKFALIHVNIAFLTNFHSDDILGARMSWKPKEARILKNFIDQPV